MLSVPALLAAAVLALAAERLIIRPLQQRQASEAITLLALFGIMLVVRYGTGAIHGRLDEPLPGPAGNHVFRLGTRCFRIFPIVGDLRHDSGDFSQRDALATPELGSVARSESQPLIRWQRSWSG